MHFSKNNSSGPRLEYKYLIDSDVQSEIVQYLKSYTEVDQNSVSTLSEKQSYSVSSLYYDTYGLDAFWSKYNGDHLRRKYRLRFYNGEYNKGRLEVKKKKGPLVWKDYTSYEALKENEDKCTSFLRDVFDQKGSDAKGLSELHFYMSYYGLQPKVWINYDRIALVDKFNLQNRLTFDSNLSFKSVNEFMPTTSNSFSFPLEKNIFEIKVSDPIPWWLNRLLREVNCYKKSFSKYYEVLKYEKIELRAL
jgi:hypothetical protein